MTLSTQSFWLNGRSALPAVGFGTYLISNDDVAEAVRQAIVTGYRHIDTAEVYGNEEGVGAGIRAGLKDAHIERGELFVTTKLWPGVAEWGETPKSAAATRAAFQESLSRLGLDYVDLYLIHAPHAGARRLEQWAELLDLNGKDLARAVGVSNFNQAHLEEIAAAGLARPDANQIELHPWSQKPDLVAYMRMAGIQPIAYSSLAPLSSWRTGQDSAKTDAMKDDDGIFADMAAKYNVTEAQLLLRWGIQKGYAILPKSTKLERMRQNLDLAHFSITEEDMAALASMDRGKGLAWSVGDPIQVS